MLNFSEQVFEMTGKNGDNYTVYTVIDDETGANYYWIVDDSGNSQPIMCPRYDKKGNIMITKK